MISDIQISKLKEVNLRYVYIHIYIYGQIIQLRRVNFLNCSMAGSYRYLQVPVCTGTTVINIKRSFAFTSTISVTNNLRSYDPTAAAAQLHIIYIYLVNVEDRSRSFETEYLVNSTSISSHQKILIIQHTKYAATNIMLTVIFD